MTVRANKPAFNVREKLKELERPIGVKGNELMRAETAQDARDLVSAGRKNLIINGNFRISQRGDYTSSTALSGNTYTLDRWKTLRYGGATIQHKTNQLLPNGDISDSALATVTSTGYTGFEQFIEFPEIYSGQTFTVSFWIKTNYISTEINVYNGSMFPLTSAQGRLNETSGEWKYFSRTFTMPSSGNSMFRIEVWTGSATTPVGSYIELAQVQVEKGTNATEFEHRSYGEELALCQRYFQSIFPDGVAPQNGYWSANTDLAAGWAGLTCFSSFNTRSPKIFFNVPMRAQPTVTLYAASSDDANDKWSAYSGTAWSTPTSHTINYFGNVGFGVRYNSMGFGTVGETYLYRGMWTATAEL